MNSFRNLSIKHKLTVMIALTTTVALLLAFAASTGFEYYRFRESVRRDLMTQAEIVGFSSAVELAFKFKDPSSAKDTLELLGRRKDILSARVYRADGRVFSEYIRPDINEPPPPLQLDELKRLFRFEGSRALVCLPIHFRGEEVGYVSLRGGFHEQLADLNLYILMVGVAMVILLLVAVFLSSILQRLISVPILSLANVSRTVAQNKDYSLRARKLTDDEIGSLVQDFNQMLGEIQRHDADLRASEERFRQIAENIHGVLWMGEPAKDDLLYVSPGYEEIWGMSRESLMAHPQEWLNAVHSEDRQRVCDALPKQELGEFDETYRVVRPDGSMRWVHARAFPIRNANGEVYRIAGIAEDITERKRADAALQEKDQRLRAVVNRAPIIVFALDQNGVITTEQGRALHDVNAPPGQNVGRHMAEVFADHPKVIENLNRSLYGEEFTDIEEFAGQVFSTWHAPQRDDHGQITGMVGVATNVTERYRLERQVLEISDREQVRIGQDLHDGLCQHLVGVAFTANSLEESLANRGLPEVSVAHDISVMLDEAISQARGTAYGLYPVRLEAEGLASALGELVSHVSARYGLDCRIDYPEPVPLWDNVVTIQLYRIAQEAVMNAVKHANAREIIIQLTRSDGRVNLSVSDDGVGIGEPARNHQGMGLNIMAYRARTIGGTFVIRRRSQSGTEVTCHCDDPGLMGTKEEDNGQ